MIKPKFPNLKDYIDNDTPTVKAGSRAHEGYIVPEIIFSYGNPKNHILRVSGMLPTMFRTLGNTYKSYKSVVNNPPVPLKTAGKIFISGLRDYALGLGCSAVGFTEVPPDLIFRDKEILFSKAIVLTAAMDKTAIQKAPKRQAGAEVWRTYRDLGIIVNRIAEYMRKNGYNAQAGPALGGEVNYVMLAQKAGLGHIGMHGMLISPETGPCQRIAVVYTDIENLPFTDTQASEYDWIESFCKTCGRCSEKCPGDAIYGSPLISGDGSRQYIDYKKCAVPFSLSMGCSVCIRECTFTRGSYSKIKDTFNGKTGIC